MSEFRAACAAKKRQNGERAAEVTLRHAKRYAASLGAYADNLREWIDLPLDEQLEKLEVERQRCPYVAQVMAQYLVHRARWERLISRTSAEWEATHGPPVTDRRVALCEHCGHMWTSDVHPDDPRLATERFACPECRAVSAHFVEPKMFFTSGPSLAAQLALEEMGLS